MQIVLDRNADDPVDGPDLENLLEESQAILPDHPHDRTMDHPRVGREVAGEYHNGVFRGRLEYFNSSLQEFAILYKDDSWDWVAEDMIVNSGDFVWVID